MKLCEDDCIFNGLEQKIAKCSCPYEKSGVVINKNIKFPDYNKI